MTYLKEDQKLLLPGLPSCLSYLSVYISLASPLTAPTHEPAFQALSILPLYCHHCFCLHPFHSSALTFFLLSSNFIISGMILQYYHLSAFILVLSNSFLFMLLQWSFWNQKFSHLALQLNVQWFFSMLREELSYTPAILLLVTYPKKRKHMFT